MRLLLLLLPAVLVIVGIGAYLSPDDLSGCKVSPDTDTCRAADVIIAVSGGDTAARTAEAIRLYQNGWAPKLVFSGAAQDVSSPSNAAVMRDIALQAGVPEQAIMIEGKSRTTTQNAQNVRALLGNNGHPSIIVVTSAYHQRRAGLEFERSFGGVGVRNHPVARDRQWSSFWMLSPRGWYLALGEFAKIMVLHAEGLFRAVSRR